MFAPEENRHCWLAQECSESGESQVGLEALSKMGIRRKMIFSSDRDNIIHRLKILSHSLMS